MSVIDLAAAVVKATYPEATSEWCSLRFGGRGQRDTPVTDARAVIMVLPGRAAAVAFIDVSPVHTEQIHMKPMKANQ